MSDDNHCPACGAFPVKVDSKWYTVPKPDAPPPDERLTDAQPKLFHRMERTELEDYATVTTAKLIELREERDKGIVYWRRDADRLREQLRELREAVDALLPMWDRGATSDQTTYKVEALRRARGGNDD